jgi:hypothetical protein
MMETALGLIIGIGLSAACGFRVFVPLLGTGLATLSGLMMLSSGFQWIGTWPAVVAFATATLLEIGAYFIPWLDNLMDTIAMPAAVAAGTILTASQLGDISPFLKWSLALIAGGGAAGVVQAGTTLTRGTSSIASGGATNALLSTGELVGSALTTALAILVPFVCLFLVGALLFSDWPGASDIPQAARPHAVSLDQFSSYSMFLTLSSSSIMADLDSLMDPSLATLLGLTLLIASSTASETVRWRVIK